MINLEKYLTKEQLETFVEYAEMRERAFEEGWHHWQRIARSRSKVTPVEVEHCVLYEHPYDLEATCPVMHPSGRFLAELMAGGIHPPIEAVHNQQLLIISKSGEYTVVSKRDAAEWREQHAPIATEIVVDNRRCHNEVEGPMSYEQAIEYCILKDIPRRVWDESNNHNYQKFWIVNKDTVKDRTYRNAWQLISTETQIAA